MSLSGIVRVTNGRALVRQAHQTALLVSIKSGTDAHALLTEVCRRLLADRPPDLAEALRALFDAQQEVNEVISSGPPLEAGELGLMEEVITRELRPTYPHQVRGRRLKRGGR